jgi:hypothetical protein
MAKRKKQPLYHKAIDELWNNGVEPRLKKLEGSLAKLSRQVNSQNRSCIGFKYTPPEEN